MQSESCSKADTDKGVRAMTPEDFAKPAPLLCSALAHSAGALRSTRAETKIVSGFARVRSFVWFEENGV